MRTLIASSLAAAALAAGCATTGGLAPAAAPSATAESASEASTGAKAPDFTLRDTEGRDVRLSDFAGKVVLIDFWATWCEPCKAAMPHLQELYAKYADKGFVILGVSMDGPETMAYVGPTLSPYGITFPVLLDEETRVTQLLNPKRAAPMQIYIDRQGRIAGTRSGYNEGDDAFVEADVARLIEQP